MLPAGREPQRAIGDEDHKTHHRCDPLRAQIELPLCLALGLSEQPRRLTRIKPIAVVGCRALIDVVCTLHGPLPQLALYLKANILCQAKSRAAAKPTGLISRCANLLRVTGADGYRALA